MASSAHSSDSEADVCWVCLADGKDSRLEQPCKCPRMVHRACLARWQLQSAGRSEERVCRFCQAELPDWREGVTPEGLRPASPVMSIHHNGETYMVKVSPGPDGLRQFQQEVRRLLRLEEDQDFDISFECRVPGSASSDHPAKMELKGMSAFDAAVYCASITAGERLMQAKQQEQQLRQQTPSPVDPRPMDIDSPSDGSANSDHDMIRTHDLNNPPPSAPTQLWAPDPRLSAPRFHEGGSRGPRQALRSAQSYDPNAMAAPAAAPAARAVRGGSQPTAVPLPACMPPASGSIAPVRNINHASPTTAALRSGFGARAPVSGARQGERDAGLGPFGRAVHTAATALASQMGVGEPLRVTRCVSKDAATAPHMPGLLAPNASFQAVLRRRPMPSPDSSAGGSDADDEHTGSDVDMLDCDHNNNDKYYTKPLGTVQYPTVKRDTSSTYNDIFAGASSNSGASNKRSSTERALLSRARYSASLPAAPPTLDAADATRGRAERAATVAAPPPSPVGRAASLPVSPPPAERVGVPYGIAMAGNHSVAPACQTLVTKVSMPLAPEPAAASALTGMSAFASQAANWVTNDLISCFPASGAVPEVPDSGSLLEPATSSRSMRSGALPDRDSVTAALNASELLSWGLGGSGLGGFGTLQSPQRVSPVPLPGRTSLPRMALPGDGGLRLSGDGRASGGRVSPQMPAGVREANGGAPRGRRYAPPLMSGAIGPSGQWTSIPSMLGSAARSFGPTDM